MKPSKIIAIISFIWLLLSAATEADLIDTLPIQDEVTKQWVKWTIAVVLIALNMFFVKPEIVKRPLNKSPNPK